MTRTKTVTAMDNSQDRSLDIVFNPTTGQYFVPSSSTSIKNIILNKILQILAGKGGPPAAILDTGMLSGHPFLRKKIAKSVDFTNEGPEDLNGHGTLVALIFSMTAPNTPLLNIKVLDKDKWGFKEDLIQGLRWAESHGASVINLSLGIEREEGCSGTCDVCRETSRIVKESGIIVVAATGNNPDIIACPANCEDVISVGFSTEVHMVPTKWWQ